MIHIKRISNSCVSNDQIDIKSCEYHVTKMAAEKRAFKKTIGLISEGYCSWVCLCVCLLSHISPMEHLFVLKTLSCTQQAMKVKIYVGFSLKMLLAEIERGCHSVPYI